MSNRIANLVASNIHRRTLFPPREMFSDDSQPLNHINRLARILSDQNSYWEASQALIYGGWSRFIREYFYESPDPSSGDDYSPMIIFPGEELAAPRIEPIPLIYSNNLSVGQIMIHTAWARGLTPRLLPFNNADGAIQNGVALKFVKRCTTLPYNIDSPPHLRHIDSMISSSVQSLNTQTLNHGRGAPLIDVRDFLVKMFPSFNNLIGVHPRIQTLLISVNISTNSLCEFLDEIAHASDVFWEWGNGKIWFHPWPGASNFMMKIDSTPE